MQARSSGLVYPHTASQAAFLLGGIGTGNFSIGARGDLRDWEIFNRPAKGLKLPYTFFAIRCDGTEDSTEDGALEPAARVIEAPVQPPYSDPLGLHSGTASGLPHFQSSRLRGEYPFVTVDFHDDRIPVRVSLEAFTPFLPLNADDSSIPGAILRYEVANAAKQAVGVSIVGSLPNAVGFAGFDPFGNLMVKPGTKNSYRGERSFRGISFTSTELAADDPEFGTMSLVTTDTMSSFKEAWLNGGWFDGIQDFWEDFLEDGELSPESAFGAPGSRIHSHQERPLVGSVCVRKVIEPGATATFTFIIAWHFPNRPRGWNPERGPSAVGNPPTVRNHYATRFDSAWAACAYIVGNLERLEGLSRAFHNALFGSSLPPSVIDALAANITVIRSPTCFRLEDGTFASWEGCFDDAGSCEGSCTHVWNYAQTLGFLFPELERSMLQVAFNRETDEEGRMAFRTHRIFGLPGWDMVPAADGQLGTIIRLYRYWKLTGDDAFVRSVWRNASRCIDFAFRHWDTDGDCVLDGEQHTTYDIELHGQSSYTSLIFYAALKAGAEIAIHFGETELGARYGKALEAGSRLMDSCLWNGEYYVQRIEDVNAYRYQYGEGCLSDQLLGQSLALTAGIGTILPREHARSALASVFARNFRKDFRGHSNTQRSYALNDESGLVLCSWPRGGRPKLPFVYCDEVWSGVEYQVATHLFHEGLLDEGLQLVEAVRARYDGFKRNPWNEIECGHHYVRSMASWGLLIALSGYEFDIPRGMISFSPRLAADDFSCFFSTGSAWGTYRQRRDPGTGKLRRDVEVMYGSLDGVTVGGRRTG